MTWRILPEERQGQRPLPKGVQGEEKRSKGRRGRDMIWPNSSQWMVQYQKIRQKINGSIGATILIELHPCAETWHFQCLMAAICVWGHVFLRLQDPVGKTGSRAQKSWFGKWAHLKVLGVQGSLLVLLGKSLNIKDSTLYLNANRWPYGVTMYIASQIAGSALLQTVPESVAAHRLWPHEFHLTCRLANRNGGLRLLMACMTTQQAGCTQCLRFCCALFGWIYWIEDTFAATLTFARDRSRISFDMLKP
jgi:hypothetical protein